MRTTVLLIASLLCSSAGFAQERAEAGPYKAVLDRLESLTVQAQPEWRYHADVPHPEHVELSDADWPTVKTREVWKSGARVLRRRVEMPEKINGYATVPTLQWADLSDAHHGLSLLNDCKYGYDAKGNVLRVSLLRSPEWPDPHADEGEHEFTYAIYSHAGSWREAQTVRQGYELNYPLLSLQTEKHQGQLKDAFSFLSVGADNVVITAVKRAEDDGALIIRFYEWAGKGGDVQLRLPPEAESAAETDLMEKAMGNLPLQSGKIAVPTKPYEIKTVRVQFTAPH
jgi:alpha-mannosidase